MAYVVVIHDIRDPDRFWSTPPEFPPGVSLHTISPRSDGRRAVCLWEGESVDVVRGVVEDAVGQYSQNEYFEVDQQHPGALGLPSGTTAAA